MRLRHIEVFYSVYRHGSISGAARDLNVSQPSVSKVLRHAEDQLGYPLFERIKGRLSPTDAAHELFIEVEDVYARMRSLDQTAKNIRTRRGGHIRLGVLPSLGLRAVPAAIARFREGRGEVSFEINTLHTREVARALFEREYDIAIGYGQPVGPGLLAKALGTSELLLVAPSATFGAAAEIDIRSLDGVDFIGFRDSGPIGDVFTKQLADNDVVPREVVTARTYYIALSLVRLGVGISVVDNFTAASVSDAAISSYVFKSPIRCPVNAIVLEDHPQPKLVTDFLTTLKDIVMVQDPRTGGGTTLGRARE